MHMILPNVIIAGVGRCGTTSLFRYLSKHPDICTSTIKETQFFMREIINEEALKEYAGYFSHCNAHVKIRLEASPGYSNNATHSASLIKHYLDNPKIIFMLRNPADRFSSVYRSYKRTGVIKESVSFNKFILCAMDNGDPLSISGDKAKGKQLIGDLGRGIYTDILNEYIKYFNTSQIYIEFLENLSQNPSKTMEGIARFLSIDVDFYSTKNFYSIENKAIPVRWPYLYRSALSLNRKFELILNKTPGMRRMFRKLHSLLNEAKQPQEKIITENKKLLCAYYQAPNLLLRELINKHWVNTNIPDWLAHINPE